MAAEPLISGVHAIPVGGQVEVEDLHLLTRSRRRLTNVCFGDVSFAAPSTGSSNSAIYNLEINLGADGSHHTFVRL